MRQFVDARAARREPCASSGNGLPPIEKRPLPDHGTGRFLTLRTGMRLSPAAAKLTGESPGCRTPVSQSYGNAFRIPHPAGRLWERLCHRKWLMLFSSSKGITGKRPEPWIPPRGKPEKKAVFSPHCGDETTIYSNKALGNAEGASLKREMPQHYFLLIMCSGARMSSSFSRLRRFRASTMSSTEPPVSRASLAMDAEVS